MHERCRDALEHDPRADRDDRRQDARDRRHDAHPADGQAPVQRRDADTAEHAGDDAQQQVATDRERLASDQGEGQREGHARELGHEHDTEHRGPPAGQTAAEVAGTPRGGGGQAEHHGERASRQVEDQALASPDVGWAGARDGSSTASSTAVGPGNSTTASAAASYRSDVVR